MPFRHALYYVEAVSCIVATSKFTQTSTASYSVLTGLAGSGSHLLLGASAAALGPGGAELLDLTLHQLHVCGPQRRSFGAVRGRQVIVIASSSIGQLPDGHSKGCMDSTGARVSGQVVVADGGERAQHPPVVVRVWSVIDSGWLHSNSYE